MSDARYGAAFLSPLGWVRGERVRRDIANPAAGTDWSITMQSGGLWVVETMTATFATSAVAASRAPFLRIQDADGKAIWSSYYQLNVGASSNGTYVVSMLGGTLAGPGGSGTSTFGIPLIPLEPGWALSSSTVLIDAGDQWSQLRFLLCRIDVGTDGYDFGRVFPPKDAGGSIAN